MTTRQLVAPLAQAAFLAALTLAGCSSTESPLEPTGDPAGRGLAPAVTYELLVSSSGKRTSPIPLAGRNLSGKVYIFTNPDTNVDGVVYYLDGKKIRFDRDPRFDFMGTGGAGNAKPWDTGTVTAGSHTIRADVRLFGGATVRLSETFTIGSGGGSTPNPVPTSITVAPSQASLLTGATRQFGATVRDQNNQPMSASITWQATGGSIAPGGLYTAGLTPGNFSVTARSGTLQSSAAVRIDLPSTPPPTGGQIVVQPGQDIQSLVDASPTGAAFLLKAGLHRRQSVTPKSGQTFIGENGAVMDGEDAAGYAFQGTAQNPNVTIRNIEIRNYAPNDLTGAIRVGNFPGSSTAATGWTVEDCDIHHNLYSGVMIGDGLVLRNNHIHHNHQTNVTGYADDVLIEGNEISYANYQGRPDFHVEMSGIKMKKTSNVRLRNNFVHHNFGKGIWFDDDNIDLLIEGNRIEDNDGAGILHEIGYRGIIRNNQIRRNGFGEPGFSWLWLGAIVIANSSDVEVHGNTVEDNIDGIGGVQQNRGSGRFGPWTLKNLYVHDNTIVQRANKQWTSHSGAVQDIGSSAIFASGNVRFVRNHYTVYGTKNDWFRWKDGLWTWSQWRADGQDAGGSFVKH